MVERSIPVSGGPAGLAWSEDSRYLYVSEFEAARAGEIVVGDGAISRRIPLRRYPLSLAVCSGRDLLMVGEYFSGSVSGIDLRTGEERFRVPVVREPSCIAMTRDDTRALVSNLLPGGRSDTTQAAV